MSLKSMTAFGTGENQTTNFQYICEIKSLNSRFLEINPRLPKFLSSLETEIVHLMKSKLNRGKIELYFDIKATEISETLPKVNESAVVHYLNCAQQISSIREKNSIPSKNQNDQLSISHLLNLEGVLDNNIQSNKERTKIHKEPLLKAVDLACDQLIADREREGKTLYQSIFNHLKELQNFYEEIKVRAPEIRESLESHYFNKIQQVKQTLIEKGYITDSELSQERLTSEFIILADKIDVAEELDRFKAHLDEFSLQLEKGSVVGRKLDFICQELHREANTLSNKLVQAEIAKLSVEMKQNIERVKQQVQNIE